MSAKKSMFFVLGVGLWMASPSTISAAPTLKVGTVSSTAGSAVQLPITFKTGSGAISALQFNLTLPPHITPGTVTPSASLTATGKSVTANVHGQVWTFIIYGPNQTTLNSGDLLSAGIMLSPQTPEGAFKIEISGIVFSDPKAQSIKPGVSTSGILKVGAKTSSK